MTPALDFPLGADGPVSRAVLARGFDGFAVLAEHIRQLAYGRPQATQAVLAVLEEGYGTCSGKHRLLATVAHECGHGNIELIVGVYAMSEGNTPGVGAVLEAAAVDSIAEAHCYLRRAGERFDYTGVNTSSESPFQSLMSEQVVAPRELPLHKAAIQRRALQHWASRHDMTYPQASALRERCIAALSGRGSR